VRAKRSVDKGTANEGCRVKGWYDEKNSVESPNVRECREQAQQQRYSKKKAAGSKIAMA
jgi:hypothetical protein